VLACHSGIGMPLPEVLRGDGVWLRPWREAYAPAVDSMRDDTFVVRWSGMADEPAGEWIARHNVVSADDRR
jgi:hypothetical protein